MMFSGRLGLQPARVFANIRTAVCHQLGVFSEDYAIMVFLFLRPGLHGGMGGRCDDAACTFNRVRTGHAVRD